MRLRRRRRSAETAAAEPQPLFPSKWSSLDASAWHILSPLATCYVPWALGALRPSALVAILNDIAVRRRMHVVECGGGMSTLFIARLLRERGAGRLITLEHDPGWARWLEEQVDREGLAGQVSIVNAPLASHPLAVEDNQWYSEEPLGAALERDVDLLLVDGPPAFAPGQGLSRYPALPALHDRLTPGATVVLDDINRSGERAVLGRWEAETEFRFQRRHVEGGIAIGMRGGHEPLFP